MLSSSLRQGSREMMSCECSPEVGSLFLPIPVVPEFRGAPGVRTWWQNIGRAPVFFLRPHFTDLNLGGLSATQQPGSGGIPSIDTPGTCTYFFSVFYFLPFPNPL